MEILKKMPQVFTVSLLSFLFLIGCQKDINPGENERSMNLSIDDAKSFFNNNLLNEAEKSTNIENPKLAEILKGKKANWDIAYSSLLSNGHNAIRIPLSVSDSVFWKFSDNTESKVDFNLLNYLMMYRDTTSKIHAEWVTLMPDSSWLKGTRNTYSGKILIRKWNGDAVRLYDFSGGKSSAQFNVRSTTEALSNAKMQLTFQTVCFEVPVNCPRLGDKNSRTATLHCTGIACETIIIDGGTGTGSWDPWGGKGSNNGGGNSTGGSGGNSSGGGNNYTPTCNPNLPSGSAVSGNQLPPCIPIWKPVTGSGDLTLTRNSYSQSELETIVQNLKDPITGQGISLFLVENYRGSKAIKAVYQHVAGDNLTVGEYTLAKNYDSNGNLISYYAWRNGSNGIEYMIKANQLDAFRQNIDYYTSAANLVYLGGKPSQGAIALMSGNYMDGLLTMWDEALRDPNYYIYAANVLVMSSTNLKPNNITYKNVTASKVSRPNYEITSHSFSEFKSLIQQKHGGTWRTAAITPKGLVQNLEVGNIKYTARPFASNTSYDLTIDYFRGGEKIGEFRFNR